MSVSETTTTQPAKRPVHVVRRTALWEGDLVSLHVPKRARVLTFDQEGQKFTYLAFQFAIFGEKFVDVFVRPAGSEMVGTEIEGWLSIWEKRLSDGRIYRYIDIEPADEADLDEPICRCFKVVPNRPEEVEIREGWMFYGIPHPFKPERTLRGAILLYPAGDKVRVLPVATESVAKVAGVAQPAPTAHEPEHVVEASSGPMPEAVEMNQPVAEPAPTPEPVRMGEVLQPKRERKPRNTEKPALVTPRVDPAQLAQLAEQGFGIRQYEGATPVF